MRKKTKIARSIQFPIVYLDAIDYCRKLDNINRSRTVEKAVRKYINFFKTYGHTGAKVTNVTIDEHLVEEIEYISNGLHLSFAEIVRGCLILYFKEKLEELFYCYCPEIIEVDGKKYIVKNSGGVK